MTQEFLADLAGRIETLKADGLFKQEQVISSPQQGEVTLETGAACINLCANNYLGLSNHPRLVEAARAALSRYGFGMSSVRFICGTQVPHKQLEERLSAFLGTEDTILFPSCFDANAGLFESLLDEEDAIISDALNHASIIDGVRLCRAKRFRYANNDMADLEARLQRGGRRALPPDRHGRGLFDGRLYGRSAGHLRPGGETRRPRDGGRQPCRRLRRRKRTGHARALWRRRAGRHPDGDARQGAGRCCGGLRLGPARHRGVAAPERAPPTSSPTRRRPSSPRPAWRRWTFSPARRSCGIGSGAIRGASAPK